MRPPSHLCPISLPPPPPCIPLRLVFVRYYIPIADLPHSSSSSLSFWHYLSFFFCRSIVRSLVRSVVRFVTCCRWACSVSCSNSYTYTLLPSPPACLWVTHVRGVCALLVKFVLLEIAAVAVGGSVVTSNGAFTSATPCAIAVMTAHWVGPRYHHRCLLLFAGPIVLCYCVISHVVVMQLLYALMASRWFSLGVCLISPINVRINRRTTTTTPPLVDIVVFPHPLPPSVALTTSDDSVSH